MSKYRSWFPHNPTRPKFEVRDRGEEFLVEGEGDVDAGIHARPQGLRARANLFSELFLTYWYIDNIVQMLRHSNNLQVLQQAETWILYVLVS